MITLNNPMNKTTYWEANSFLHGKEIPSVLRNLKVHYTAHKGPSNVLRQMNPVHTLKSCSFKLYFNIVTYQPTDRQRLTIHVPANTAIGAVFSVDSLLLGNTTILDDRRGVFYVV
jgi:hypothetical protein